MLNEGSDTITVSPHEKACITVNNLTDPQTHKAMSKPIAAMCVRKSSVRRVLQFTPFIGASSVLHRPASRVIHRLQLYCFLFLLDSQRIVQSMTEMKAIWWCGHFRRYDLSTH